MTEEQKARLAELLAKSELTDEEKTEKAELEKLSAAPVKEEEKKEEEKKEDEAETAKSLKKVFSKMEEAATKAAEKAVESTIKKMDHSVTKYLHLNPEETPAEKTLAKQQLNLDFLKALLAGKEAVYAFHKSHPEAYTKASLSGLTSNGGAELVPDEFRNDLIIAAQNYGLARKYASIIPMSSDVLNTPKITSEVDVYEVAQGSAGTESALTTDTVQLLVKDILGIKAFNNSWFDDVTIDVMGTLMDMFGRAFAKFEDMAMLTGGSATAIEGILENASTIPVTMDSGTTGADITIDDLINMQDVLPDEAEEGAMFIFHKTFLSALRRLKDVTSGQYILQPGGNGVPATLCGKPYVTSPVMPAIGTVSNATKCVIYGNPKHYYLGDRQQVSMYVGREGLVGAQNLLQENKTAVRFVERIAGKLAIPEWISVLATHS